MATPQPEDRPDAVADSRATPTDIVLVHGMWGHGDQWRRWREMLPGLGWRVHSPTLRHHDHDPTSPPPDALGSTSLVDYVDDLEKLVRRLPARPVVVGHSMGGLLAQILAARQLVSAAVLLTPAPPRGILALRPSVLWSFRRPLMAWRFWERPHRPTFPDAVYSMLHRLPPGHQRVVYEEMRWESGRAASEIGLALLDRRRASAVDPAAVRCPVLTVAGRHDRITPAGVVRKIAHRYGAELVELPDHGHWVLSGPGWEDIAAMVEDWIRRHSPVGEASSRRDT